MYSGVYNCSKKHEADLQQVLERSWEAGLSKIIITAGNLEDSRKALELAQQDGKKYFFICSFLSFKMSLYTGYPNRVARFIFV